MIDITIGSATDIGQRDNNEDSVLAVVAQDPVSADESPQPMAGAGALLILADGMGGRARGQIASQTAVKIVYRELVHILAMRSECDASYLENSLHNALRQANTRVRELSSGGDSEAMGTTCTVVLAASGMISVAHIGDSRASLIAPHSRHIQPLTEDHSVVADEVKAGRITEAQARRSKFRNVITRALGVEESVTPDFAEWAIESGVTHLILTSDGLHGSVPDSEIADQVMNAHSPQAAADSLVAEALARGAKDNISVIVARIAADVKGNALHTPQANHARRARASRWPGNIIAFLFGLLVAAGSVWLAFPHLLHPTMSAVPNLNKSAAPPAPINLTTTSYAAPVPLLGRSVMGGILISAGGDFLVVDPSLHQVLRVRPDTGQIITAVPDGAHLEQAIAPRETYWATDIAGDLYQSQTAPPLIRKFNAEGQFLRTIGQGILNAPGALWVAPDGDVYVIDSGTLKRIPAVPFGQNAQSATPHK